MKTSVAALAIAASAVCAAAPAIAGWTGAQAIDAGTGICFGQPRVAFDGGGNAISVFREGTRIHANRFEPAIGWGTAVAVDAGTAGHLFQNPQIALSPDGTGIAVFEDMDGGGIDHIGANGYAGWAWSGAAGPLDSGVRSAWAPQISCDSQGRGMLLYYKMDGALDDRLYARRYTPSGGWDAVVGPIDANTGEGMSNPRVALAPDGDGFAVFQQWTGPPPAGYSRVWANRFAAGSWGISPTPLDPGGFSCDYPSIAVNSAGDAVAGFRASAGAEYRLYAARYHGGAWGAAERIDGGSASTPSSPEVAIDDGGNSIAVFTKKKEGILRAYAARYDASSGEWGAPQIIDHSPGISVSNACVAVNGSGGGVAAYQVVAANGGVYGNAYSPGAGWAGAQRIDAGSTLAQDPSVAVEPSGNAIAVFRQDGGAVCRVYANRYVPPTPTPAPTATPAPPIDLKVNKNTFGASDHIAVTADVQAIGTPFYPFVRIGTPDGSTLYYAPGTGLTPAPTPYLAGGPFTLASPIAGYPIAEADFAGIAPGTYCLEGGAVDATQTTSASNLYYVNPIDRETLVVQ